jgi:hypothetical protein
MRSTITRTTALRRLLVALGGVVGLGAGGAAAATVAGGGGARAQGVRTMTLYARDVHRSRSGVAHEPRPGRRDTRTHAAQLLDARRSPVGQFSGAPVGDGATQLHTFALADGAIFGLAASDAAGAAHAIVGGTGRYAGATGTYTVRPAKNLPGHSTELNLTLTAWEV